MQALRLQRSHGLWPDLAVLGPFCSGLHAAAGPGVTGLWWPQVCAGSQP